ncbi:MaoC/PaaZ C-terminal domain-containing protein [Citricoccus sp. GCM10030269]|uniref:MaoC/PaaZ C-terminal domain-containing protein n=1 Tax=Citricoccus sp. GCM10030269 TaxID=3273388 RepID=UPI00360A9B4E
MERETMTPLLSSYRKALTRAAGDAVLRRRRPPELPGHAVVVHDHVIDPELVDQYARLFAPAATAPDPADLPSVLVHVAAFPAAMELMADAEFPLPLLGLVHLQNRVDHHAPVPSGVPLEIAASATHLAPHHAGTTVDLVVTVHGPGDSGSPQVLWEGTSTYLATGVHLHGHDRPQRAARPTFVPPPLTARWTLPASTGRDYAAVSGDYNPIHLNPVAARALGQKSMIAHGMYLAGRMLAGREPEGAGHSWSIDFATPARLPGTVSLHFGHPDPGTTEVTAWNARSGKPHFTGMITVP